MNEVIFQNLNMKLYSFNYDYLVSEIMNSYHDFGSISRQYEVIYFNASSVLVFCPTVLFLKLFLCDVKTKIVFNYYIKNI